MYDIKPVKFRATNGKEFGVRVTRTNKLSFRVQLLKPDGKIEKVVKVRKRSHKLFYKDEKGGLKDGNTLFGKKSKPILANHIHTTQ